MSLGRSPNRSWDSSPKTGTRFTTVSDKPRHYPIALNVTGRPCLVIGQTEEALEKAARLSAAGAKVKVVAPRAFRPQDLSSQFLVILFARDNPALTKSVARICRAKRILLCAVDQPAYCDVINVSVYERGPLRLTASTSGVAPGLAKKIRLGLEESLKDAPLELFLKGLSDLRRRLEKQVPDPKLRRKTLLAAVDGFEFKAKVKLPAPWRPKHK